MDRKIPTREMRRRFPAQKQHNPPCEFREEERRQIRRDRIEKIELPAPEFREVTGRTAEGTWIPGHAPVTALPDGREQKPHSPGDDWQCGDVTEQSENRPVQNAVSFHTGGDAGSVPVEFSVVGILRLNDFFLLRFLDFDLNRFL